MEKQLLLSFIQKYYLGGKIESVAWESNGSLTTKFISDDKSLLGFLEYKSLQIKEFKDAKLGIYKTSQLLKLLGVLEEKIEPKLSVVGEKPVSIRFEDDNNTKINFALSDLVVIPFVPPLKHEPTKYEVVITINEDFVNKFTKAKNALPEAVNFTVNSTSKKVDIVFGQTDVNTNLVVLAVDADEHEQIDSQVYDATLFKEVLLANKGLESKLFVSKEGLSKVVFDNDEYSATYYLVAKDKQ